MTHFSQTTLPGGKVVITFPTHALGGEQGIALSAMVASAVAEHAQLIVLDLSNVEVMNSTGLGMLVSTLATAGRSNVGLILAAVPERVQRLLEMTHLHQVFQVAPTVNEATAP